MSESQGAPRQRRQRELAEILEIINRVAIPKRLVAGLTPISEFILRGVDHYEIQKTGSLCERGLHMPEMPSNLCAREMA